LFKGRHAGGRITRALTGGHVDHVAMILKFEKEKPDDEEIYIFESTGDTGVSLNKWRDVRDFFGTKDSFYSELIYRRV